MHGTGNRCFSRPARNRRATGESAQDLVSIGRTTHELLFGTMCVDGFILLPVASGSRPQVSCGRRVQRDLAGVWHGRSSGTYHARSLEAPRPFGVSGPPSTLRRVDEHRQSVEYPL